jgi:hypothetical protein
MHNQQVVRDAEMEYLARDQTRLISAPENDSAGPSVQSNKYTRALYDNIVNVPYRETIYLFNYPPNFILSIRYRDLYIDTVTTSIGS